MVQSESFSRTRWQFQNISASMVRWTRWNFSKFSSVIRSTDGSSGMIPLQEKDLDKYIDFAYELALDPARTFYPVFFDGIKTKEDFIAP